MLRHPAFLAVLMTSGLFVAACSKKSEPQAPATTESAPKPAAQEAAPADKPLEFRRASSETTGAAAPSPVPAEAAAAPSPDEDVVDPVLVNFFPAVYPLSKRMEGREAKVVLALEIDPKGAVADVSVVSTTSDEFSSLAVDAAKHWKFLPARAKNVPITVRRLFPYRFVSGRAPEDQPANSPLANLAYLDGIYYSIDAKGQYEPANIENPIPLLQPTPVTTKAMADGGEAQLTLSFAVDEEGRVVNVRVVEGTNAAVGEAFVDALQFWQFVPRIRGGKAMRSQIRLPVRWTPPVPEPPPAS